MGTSTLPTNEDDNLIYIPVPDITKSQLRVLGRTKISLNEENLVLSYFNGKYYGFQADCPHYGGPLIEGDIEELPDKSPCIRCPWHYWRFNIVTGDCVFPGHKDKKLTRYPIVLNNEEIRIGFQSIAAKYFTTPPP